MIIQEKFLDFMDWLFEFWHYDLKPIPHNILRWIQYRTTNRYHVLRLFDSPGYRDPRYAMIFAVMVVVERYVNELRMNCFDEDLSQCSDAEVVQRYIDWETEFANQEGALYLLWVEHYRDLLKIVEWWDVVKDSADLDCWLRRDFEIMPDLKSSPAISDPDLTELTNADTINEMLELALDLREGLWT